MTTSNRRRRIARSCVDANGLADANAVKVGPTGAGAAQTARDLGANLDATVSSRSSHDPEDVVAAFSVAGLGVVGDGATYRRCC